MPKEPIIFLYNREQVILEGLELAKCKISQKLGLDKNIVNGNFISVEGKLTPNFQIDENMVPLAHKDNLENIIKETWSECVGIINGRLAGLSNET